MLGLTRYFHYLLHDYVDLPIRKALRLKVYPISLNLSATDFCNLRCVMCNVWQFPDRRSSELSPKKLTDIFSDPLFKKVRDIGIAGGEPFLRDELVDMCQVAVTSLPSLRTLTISTHALHTQIIKEKAPRILAVCQERGIRFRLAISCDGVDEVHDRVRGIPGAFDRMIRSVRWIRKETDCSVVLGATISRYNADHAAELLSYFKHNGLRCDFRVATNIARLDNEQIVEQFRPSSKQMRTIIEFFENLSHDPWFGLERRLFYRSLSKQLSGETPNTRLCRSKDESVFLDANGSLFICAVHGAPIGELRQSAPANVYFREETEAVRSRMLREACGECVHDYRARIPLKILFMHYLSYLKLNKLEDFFVGTVIVARTMAQSVFSR